MAGLGIFLFNYLAAIKTFVATPYYIIDSAVILKTFYYSNACNAIFLISCVFHKCVFKHYVIPSNITFKIDVFNNRHLLIIIIIIITILLFIVTEEKLFLSFSMGIFLIINEYAYRTKSKHKRRLSYIVIILFLIIMITNFSRFNYVPLFIITLFVGFRLHGRANFAVLFCIGLVLYTIGSYTKTVAVSQFAGGTSFFWADFAVRFVTADFLDSYDNLLNIINYYPNRVGFIGGDTLIGSILTFIPRSIWVEKPFSMGWTLGRLWHPNVIGLSLAPSLHGELFANFGFIGGLIGFYIFGIVVSLLEKILSPKNLSLNYYICFLIFIFSRGDFLLIDVLYYTIIPYFILRIYFKNKISIGV